MPYRVPADNDYPALEAEEIRRDVAAMRRTSMADRARLAAIVVVLLGVAWIGYGTFHRHPDVDHAAFATTPCPSVITVTPLGEAHREPYCGEAVR